MLKTLKGTHMVFANQFGKWRQFSSSRLVNYTKTPDFGALGRVEMLLYRLSKE